MLYQQYLHTNCYQPQGNLQLLVMFYKMVSFHECLQNPEITCCYPIIVKNILLLLVLNLFFVPTFCKDDRPLFQIFQQVA